MYIKLKIVFYYFGIFLILTNSLFAADILSSKEKNHDPMNIVADNITYLHSTDVVIGEGNAKVTRDDMFLSADTIIFDKVKNKVYASKNVVIKQGEDILEGDEGEFDLVTRTGEVQKGHLFLKRNNVHLLAEEIKKTGLEEYEAKKAIVSTCPLPKQAWSFKADELKLSVSGDAIGTGSAFYIRNIPVLYSPIVSLPINRYRKSGFLFPDFTTSSRNGVEIEVPYYWAINDSVDMTFFQHPMSKRGWMQGAELRYALTDESKGIIRYNYLNDSLHDHDFNKDGIVRETDSRWWLRARADHKLPRDFDLKVDIDLISDIDYLKEFDGGLSGYDETNNAFIKEFGRGLSDKTDLSRPSLIQLTKNFQDAFFGAETKYFDNLVLGEQDKTPFALPTLSGQFLKKRVSDTNFYYSLDSNYTHYWRETGVTYDRFNLNPELSYPLNLSNKANLLLSSRIETSLYKKYNDDPNQRPSDYSARILYHLQGDLSTTLKKSYGGQQKILHTMRPMLTYQYRPEDKQTEIPYIDINDRLEPQNRLTYSLLSYISLKHGDSPFSASDFIRFYLEQSYDSYGSASSTKEQYGYHSYFDFYEELMQKLSYKNNPDITDIDKEFASHYFSPVYGEMEVFPFPNVYFRTDTTYNIYGHGITTANFITAFNNLFQNGSKGDIEYRYSKLTDISELNVNLHMRLAPEWFGIYQTRYSFENKNNGEFKSAYGFKYVGSCWALTTKYIKDQDEQRVTFNVELLGLGNWSVF
jgi:LPS-assembly protein